MTDTIVADYIIDKIDDNRTFVILTLHNEDGVIQASVKDNIDILLRVYKINDTVTCKTKERGKGVHEVIAITKSEKEVKGFDVNEWIDRFNVLKESIIDTDYKIVLDALFDEAVLEEFFNQPAARSNHHANTHGLLKHTVEVAEIADYLFKFSTKGDRNLLITGALMHDVGKMAAYEHDGKETQNTSVGLFIGHLPLSALFLSKIIPENVSNEKMEKLYHVILAHHGKKEWGSPVEPSTIEAEIVHLADLASCNIDGINRLKADKDGWTTKDNMFRRSFFVE